MTSLETSPDRLVDKLVAAVQMLTPEVGLNATEWPGLSTYRFTSPQPAQWAEVHADINERCEGET